MHMYWYGSMREIMDFGMRNIGWVVLFNLIRLLIVVVVVIVVVRILTRRPKVDNPKIKTSNRALEILNERLASGEITDEEYNIKRNKINQ